MYIQEGINGWKEKRIRGSEGRRRGDLRKLKREKERGLNRKLRGAELNNADHRRVVCKALPGEASNCFFLFFLLLLFSTITK